MTVEANCRIYMLSFVFSIISTIATPFVVKENAMYSLSNSLIVVVIFVGYFVLMKAALVNYEKRLSIISFIVGIVFDVFIVFGKNIYTSNASGVTNFKTWLCVLAMLPVFWAALLVAIKCFPKLNKQFHFFCGNKEVYKECSKRKKFFVIWCIIFILWLPALLAAYPGVYGYDSIYQVLAYITRNVTLSHPPMHTYMLSFCVVELGGLIGSYEKGMLCYSLIQMLCLSATFATLYVFYIRERASKLVRRIILFVFMFLPTNAIMSFSATKDVLFSAFFALTVMLLLLLAEKPQRIQSVKYDISLCVAFFMLAAWRNQGIYVIALTAVVAMILMKNYKKRILVVFTVSIAFTLFYSNCICMWLGIEKSNSLREMMSVPCVQLSRAMLYNEDELTENESGLIKEYISRYEAYGYNSGISDVMKRSFDTERFKENPMEFIKLWVNVGVKCPVTYFDAFARLTIGYWYPDMNYRDTEAYHPYWEYYSTGILNQFDEDEYLILEQTPIKGFEWLHEKLYELSYENSYQSIAIVSLFFSSGLMVWFVLFYIAVCVYRKEYMYLVPAGFVFLFVLTLLLGPVVLYRYIYPVCLACPMLLVSAMRLKDKEDISIQRVEG